MTGIPMSALDKAREQRANRPINTTDSNTTPVWNMPDELDVTVQFMTDPLDRDALFLYREAYCEEFKHVSGLWEDGPYQGRPRAEIPFSMRDVVVYDVRVDEARGLRYDNPDIIDVNGHPMSVLSEILDGSSLRWADKNGNPRPSFKLLFNVVIHNWQDSKNDKGYDRRHPQAGEHILLKFRETDWSVIASALRARRDEEGVNVVASKWKIRLIKANKAIGQDRMVEIARKGDAEPIDVDLFDPEAETVALREAFENLVIAAHSDFIGVGEQMHVIEQSTSEVPTLVDPNMMSTAGLRTKLIEAGVTVPSKVTRATLIDLYKSHVLAGVPF